MNINDFKISVGSVDLDLTTPVVMTIINITPDSFWKGSRKQNQKEIEMAVNQAILGGADIIDIGGVSTRPGAEEISVEEEIERVVMGVEIVREIAPDIVISIDSYRADVVKRIAEKFGEFIVNDISAGRFDEQMVETVAKLGLPFIAMHTRGTPREMMSKTNYGDVVSEVFVSLKKRIEELKDAGIEQIIIDPGFGFAKTIKQNYQILGRLEELKSLGYPILVGISRKSMIYRVLESTPEDALVGTSILNWEALQQGANILRVHDTKEASDTIRIFSYYNRYRF